MLPAASSPLAAELRPGRARVLGALPAVLYLEHDDGLLAVETSRGAGLPVAWRLGVAQVCWGVGSGDLVDVHADGVDLPSGPVRRVRQWRPARVKPVHRPGTTALVDALCTATSLVGSGPGLTPEADDELCGLLLVAYACGVFRPSGEHRTTLLSAALLRAAARGYAVREVVRVADAWLSGEDAAAEDLAAVKRLGATSGHAVLRGLRRGLDLIERAPGARKEELVHG